MIGAGWGELLVDTIRSINRKSVAEFSMALSSIIRIDR